MILLQEGVEKKFRGFSIANWLTIRSFIFLLLLNPHFPALFGFSFELLAKCEASVEASRTKCYEPSTMATQSDLSWSILYGHSRYLELLIFYF